MKFWQHCKTIFLDVTELLDRETEVWKLFSKKKLPQSFLRKTWHGLPTKLLKIFPQKTKIVLLRSYNSNEVDFFFTNYFTFSNSPFAKKECSFSTLMKFFRITLEFFLPKVRQLSFEILKKVIAVMVTWKNLFAKKSQGLDGSSSDIHDKSNCFKFKKFLAESSKTNTYFDNRKVYLEKLPWHWQKHLSQKHMMFPDKAGIFRRKVRKKEGSKFCLKKNVENFFRTRRMKHWKHCKKCIIEKESNFLNFQECFFRKTLNFSARCLETFLLHSDKKMIADFFLKTYLLRTIFQSTRRKKFSHTCPKQLLQDFFAGSSNKISW